MKEARILFIFCVIHSWDRVYSFNGTKWECYNIVFGQMKVTAAFNTEEEFMATIEESKSLDNNNVISCYNYIDGSALGIYVSIFIYDT